MGMCAIPQDPPPRNTSKAKLTTFKLAPLPEKYRRGYELAVERLAGRKIDLPVGATAKDAATKWHSYIHGTHLIKVTCRELQQDIPPEIALPASADDEATSTWLLNLMERKELLLKGYPEIRKLPEGYRKGPVSGDECNCFIMALWQQLLGREIPPTDLPLQALARVIRSAGVKKGVWNASPEYITATNETMDFIVNYAKEVSHIIPKVMGYNTVY